MGPMTLDLLCKSDRENVSLRRDVLRLQRRVRELEGELALSRALVRDICREWHEDCGPCCDSYGHDPNCKAVHIAEAKRALHREIQCLRSRLPVQAGGER